MHLRPSHSSSRFVRRRSTTEPLHALRASSIRQTWSKFTIGLKLLRAQPADVLVGHASIRTQLEWCRAEHVPVAIFTHSGTEVVTGDPRVIQQKIADLGTMPE